jgi:predicted RNase H-like HicB family nuclease
MFSNKNRKVTELGYIQLTLLFYKEEDQWIGECKELGISTYGDTIEEVKSELPELVELHVNALEEAGERENYFKENGIIIYSEKIPERINVPYTPDILMLPYIKNLEHVF